MTMQRGGIAASMAVLLLALAASPLGASGAGGCTTGMAPAVAAQTPGSARFEQKEIVETSGIQRSRTLPGAFWVHNDSGGDSSVFATDGTGADLGRVRLAGVRPRDWEDIAGAVIDGVSYLILADVGDNRARRNKITLDVFVEPDLACLGPGFELSVDDFTTIALTYGDGSAHDCESVAYDPATGEILLVTKEVTATEEQTLFGASLQDGLTTGSLTLAAQVKVGGMEPERGDSKSATGMDISDDGSQLSLLTYGIGLVGRIHVWDRAVGQSWDEVLGQPAVLVLDVPPLHDNLQAEGIAYDTAGDRLLTVAESTPITTSSVTSLVAPSRPADAPNNSPAPAASTADDPRTGGRLTLRGPLASRALLLGGLILAVVVWRTTSSQRRRRPGERG